MKKRARFLFAFSETTAPNGSQVDKLVILCKPKLPANVLPEHLVLWSPEIIGKVHVEKDILCPWPVTHFSGISRERLQILSDIYHQRKHLAKVCRCNCGTLEVVVFEWWSFSWTNCQWWSSLWDERRWCTFAPRVIQCHIGTCRQFYKLCNSSHWLIDPSIPQNKYLGIPDQPSDESQGFHSPVPKNPIDFKSNKVHIQ